MDGSMVLNRPNRMPTSCKLTIAILFLLIINFISDMIFPHFISKIIVLAIPVIALFALVMFLLVENQYNSLTFISRIYFWSLLFVFAVMFLSFIVFFKRETLYISSFLTDINSMVLYICGVIFAPVSRHKYFVKIYKVIGIVGVICGIIGVLLANFKVNNIAERDVNAWTISYYLWFILFSWSTLLLMHYLSSKKERSFLFMVISIASSFLYLLLGFLFMKRIVILELFIIILLISLKSEKRKLFIKGIIISLSLILLFRAITLFFDLNILNLIKITINRITSQKITNFDRIVEFKVATSDFNLYQYIFGYGFGSTHYGLGRLHGNIHIGWLNYIFKGGLLLFVIQLFAFINCLSTYIKSKKYTNKSIYSSIAVFNFIIAIISTYWTNVPQILMFSMFTFATMNLEENTIISRSKIKGFINEICK